MVSCRDRYAVLMDGELAVGVDGCGARQRVRHVYTSSSAQLTVYIVSNDTSARNFLLQYQRTLCDMI